MKYSCLIVYASGYGSTGEVATEIARVLSEQGAEVRVRELPVHEDLRQFDVVIVGSAIRYDRWMSPARAFILDNQSELNKLKVAYFFNCLTLARRTEQTEKKAETYKNSLIALSEKLKPLSVGAFGGVLDYSKMPFFLRLIFMLFGRVVGLKEGDYRDWEEIRRWARGLETEFTNRRGS